MCRGTGTALTNPALGGGVGTSGKDPLGEQAAVRAGGNCRFLRTESPASSSRWRFNNPPFRCDLLREGPIWACGVIPYWGKHPETPLSAPWSE